MMRARIAATVLGGALALSACGADPSPNDQLPQLGTTLSKVQQSLAAGETARAQAQLRVLVAQATAAREAGDLTEAQAREVLAAAENLLSALPAPKPTPPAPVTTPSPSREPTGGTDDKDEKPDKGRKGEDREGGNDD